MSEHFWLSEEQLVRIKPYFLLSRGVPRIDDRKVIGGIIHVIRNAQGGGRMLPELLAAPKVG